MTRSLQTKLLSGLVALAAAFTAAAATIPSPYRPTASPATAAAARGPRPGGARSRRRRRWRRCATAAAARRRDRGLSHRPRRDRDDSVLNRFEVAAPDARITIPGKDGESSLPMPSVAHFSGRRRRRAGLLRLPRRRRRTRLVAYVHSSPAILRRPRRDQQRLRRAHGGLAAQRRRGPAAWSCGAEDLPAALTAMAEPSYALAGRCRTSRASSRRRPRRDGQPALPPLRQATPRDLTA